MSVYLKPLIICYLCLLYVLIWANLFALYQQMSHFGISYMYAFVVTQCGFFPLCVAKIGVFFFHFPISLLTFCRYAIMIMTFIYCMFHVYLNQFGAH